MNTIHHQLMPPKLLYETLHRQIPSYVKNNYFIFDKKLGKGKFEYINLQEGLWVLQMNFELNEPLKLIREASKTNDYFAINFYLSSSEIIYENIDSAKLGLNNVSILLNAATAEIKMEIPAQTPIKIMNIGFTRQWLKKSLIEEKNTDKLEQLFLSDKPFYLSESLDYNFKNILNDLDLEKTSKLKLFSSTLQLLEYMVAKLNKREHENVIPENIHYHDFQELMKTRNHIDEQLDESIPVETLATQAGMSLSKYKRLFKQVFGTTPYQYYLNNRMERAMDLLVHREHSVTEVGFLIGYTNLSQFTKAFKTHHGILPSDVK